MSPLLGLGGLLAAALAGGVPAPLAGTWHQCQTAFVARREISPALQEQLNDSATADLNTRLRRGQTRLTLVLDPSGRYHYCRRSAGSAADSLQGPYRVSRDTLYLGALPAGAALPPVLRVVRLTRRVLVLEFLLWDPADAVYEQLSFSRS